MANPSNRWKNEAVKLVEDHNFEYLGAFDAGKDFRQEDHCCDFCGTHLRYTAVIRSKSDEEVEKEVGLDCLEHVMGTSWSRMQDVERDIKNLKEEAKRQRRKEEFQKEWGDLIDWIERYLHIKENGFLREMHTVLTTGSREFTRPMEEAVKEIYDETDLEEMREKQKEKRKQRLENERKIEKLQEIIIDVDDLETENGKVLKEEMNSTYEFVESVRNFLDSSGYITDNQMEALNDIFEEYKEKQKKDND